MSSPVVSSAGSLLQPSLRSFAGVGAAYVVGYVFLHWATYFFEYSDLGVTPWNPETGLTLVLAIKFGWIAFPVAFCAHVLGDLVTKPFFWAPTLTTNALIYAATYCVAGMFARRRLGSASPRSTSSLITLIVTGGLAALVAAALQIANFAYQTKLTVDHVFPAMFTLGTGDFIGILTISPLLLAMDLGDLRGRLGQIPPLPFCIGIIAIVAVSYVVFGLDSTDQFKVFYLVFIPVVIFSLIYGFEGAALSIIASDISMMGIIYWRDVTVSTATELQVLMISLSATGLLLGSVVSERRRFEADLLESHAKLHESQSALLHATRVTLVSEMASALAHELNQPLYATRNYVRAAQRMLGSRLAKSKDIKAMIVEAVSQIDHASDLLQHIRKFLRKEQGKFAALELSDLIERSIKLIEADLRQARIELITEFGHSRPTAIANAIQIEQVVLNLVRNSMEAIQGAHCTKRRILITASTGTRPGFVEVTVSDTGPGLSPQAQQDLFKPFATTKERGLGLGLSLCRTIISAHGGELWLDDSYSGTTRFAFTLRAGANRGGQP